MGWNEYSVNINITDQTTILKLWSYSSLSLFLILIGFWYSKNVLKLDIQSYPQFKEHNLQIKGLNSRSYVLAIFIFIISCFVFLLYLTKIPKIPIIAMLTGANTMEVQLLRSLATNDFSGYLWYSLFFNQIMVFISFIFFANLLIKQTRLSILIFAFTFLITSFALIVPTHKAPIILYLLGLGIIYLLVKGKKIKVGFIIKIGVISVPILILMYQYIMGMQGRPIIDVVQAILSRLFIGQISPAYFYLEIFPDIEEFKFGSTFPNPGGIFPWENYRLTVEVANLWFPDRAASGVVGSAPTVFWGEMYVNFGFLGVIFSSIVVGIILSVSQHLINNLKVNSISISIYVMLIFEFIKLTQTGFSMLFFNFRLLVIILVGISLLLMNRTTKRGVDL
ncbi:O-antigen polymerase [Bacillus sp. ISL-37]|uniref:O-antigen polymerase n=1 Tax=Bacillus sp. ISL-37 TaxID=2819123 RepID=UPI001BE8188C|nr:O-antigen polymerase [Bacillus sp. ISL-37]